MHDKGCGGTGYRIGWCFRLLAEARHTQRTEQSLLRPQRACLAGAEVPDLHHVSQNDWNDWSECRGNARLAPTNVPAWSLRISSNFCSSGTSPLGAIAWYPSIIRRTGNTKGPDDIVIGPKRKEKDRESRRYADLFAARSFSRFLRRVRALRFTRVLSCCPMAA